MKQKLTLKSNLQNKICQKSRIKNVEALNAKPVEDIRHQIRIVEIQSHVLTLKHRRINVIDECYRHCCDEKKHANEIDEHELLEIAVDH